MYLLLILLLLFCSCIGTDSRVMLFPSGDIAVCPGAQLSFNCSTNLSSLEWNVTVFQSGAPYSRRVLVFSTSSFIYPLTVNGHPFKVSVGGSMSISSALTVNVTNDLNDTNIYCTEEGSSPAAVTIHVITPDITYPDIPEVHGPEVLDFRKDSVIVAFDWTRARKRGISYIIDTYPPANNITYPTGASIQLQVLYNTIYNVSMKSTCGQNNLTIATSNTLLNFTECIKPIIESDDSMGVILDTPALVGTNASFVCLSGLVIIGPKQSTCMENGHWEPDPRELECKANCGSPSQPMNGVIIPYTSTTEGARVIFVCQNIHPNLKLFENNYTVSICSKQGKWEPNPGNFCEVMYLAENTMPSSQNAITAISVVSSSSVLVIILFFILGFICGYHFKRMYTKDQDKTSDNASENQTGLAALYENILPNVIMEQNLEMEQNTAYDLAKTITT